MELTNKLIKIQRKVNLIKEIVDGLHYVSSKKNNKYIREINDMFKKKYYQMGGRVGIDGNTDIAILTNGAKFINLYDEITYKTFIDKIREIGDKYDKEQNRDKKIKLLSELRNELREYYIYFMTYTNIDKLIENITNKRSKYVKFINKYGNNSLDDIKKKFQMNY